MYSPLNVSRPCFVAPVPAFPWTTVEKRWTRTSLAVSDLSCLACTTCLSSTAAQRVAQSCHGRLHAVKHASMSCSTFTSSVAADMNGESLPWAATFSGRRDNRSSALSCRRWSRFSARELNMRYGSSVPTAVRSSMRTPIYPLFREISKLGRDGAFLHVHHVHEGARRYWS